MLILNVANSHDILKTLSNSLEENLDIVDIRHPLTGVKDINDCMGCNIHDIEDKRQIIKYLEILVDRFFVEEAEAREDR
jgi:hypothetical protein